VVDLSPTEVTQRRQTAAGSGRNRYHPPVQSMSTWTAKLGGVTVSTELKLCVLVVIAGLARPVSE